MASVSNNKTSHLVSQQLPAFVREEHPLFLEFIQSYYKFMEEREYLKATKSNLTISTQVGVNKGKTTIAVLSGDPESSNVVIANGSTIRAGGTRVRVTNVSTNNRVITVSAPGLPNRLVGSELFVYRTTPTKSELISVTKNLSRYMDVDVASVENTQIRDELYEQYIKLFPRNVIADRNLILKHAKDFYRARGTENSIRFLMRVLFNKEPTFYYPKEDVLRASDGKWYVQKSLRITDIVVTDTPIDDGNTPIIFNATANGFSPIGDVGTRVSDFAAFSGAVTNGIAINFIDTRFGDWFYTLNNGAKWTQIYTTTPISNSNSLLLPVTTNTRIYFRAKVGSRGLVNPAITFRTWNLTTGTAGGYINTTTNGPGTAFSKEIYDNAINIQPIDNSRPVTNLGNYFVGRKITGALSGASATVEDVDIYIRKGELITELKVSNSTKDFLSSELISTSFELEGQVKYVSAELFGGNIVDIDIINPGTGYNESSIPLSVLRTSNTGSGARLVISRISRGGIERILVRDGFPVNGGCGYQPLDPVSIYGGGGSGAFAEVEACWDDNTIHPNSYVMIGTTIADVADIAIGSDYANNGLDYGPNLSNGGIYSTLENACIKWVFANTGPIKFIAVPPDGTGQDYTGTPTFVPEANTIIKSLGILGNMKIVNGGLNYQVGDVIEFIRRPGPNGIMGTGASANVTAVAANGKITAVRFRPVPGQITGGTGYDQNYLPLANVRSTTGNGANIVVQSCLGYGGDFTFTTETLGKIREIKILDGGVGYTSAPYIDLSKLGDGKAQVSATIVTGIYSYPGRYVNDDGFLSAKNFLQDRDYYQDFTYEIGVDKSIDRYRQTIKDLAHPAGMKLWGRYLYTDIEGTFNEAARVFSSSYDTQFVRSGLLFYADSANTTANVVTNSAISNQWKNAVNASHVGNLVNGANIVNGIAYFDGTNDYAQWPNLTSLDVNTLTVESWFRPESVFQSGHIFEKGTVNSQYSLFMYNRRLYWRVKAAGVVRDIFSIPVTNYFDQEGWTHVLATYQSGAQKIYINGNNVANNTITGSITISAGGISIGAYGGYTSSPTPRSYYFEGKIGLVRVYNRVLTPTEARRNYNSEKGRFRV